MDLPLYLISRVWRLNRCPPHSLQVPGGTQALDRTELVPVVFGEHQGVVPRPSLLGAIVGKAVAVDVDDVPDAQRLDLALLLSLVGDPLELANQLTKKDRQRLRARSEMAGADQRAWSSLSADEADRGRAAFRLLVG